MVTATTALASATLVSMARSAPSAAARMTALTLVIATTALAFAMLDTPATIAPSGLAQETAPSMANV